MDKSESALSPNEIFADEIFVFLGPTLSQEDANKILPARYLEPARCGDILSYLRLKPKVFALIDGVFDRNASVWHKEILWAMEQDIFVCGASSMGALRAAELSYFGMHGAGEIFAAYQQGKYTDDDEVAIAYTSSSDGFRCLSDAMVNIRATVAQAIQHQIIAPDLGEQIIKQAKSTFYPQRSLNHCLLAVTQAGGSPTELARFTEYLKQDGFVDQKRLDAIALLTFLRSLMEGKASVPVSSKPTLNKSMFIAELQTNLTIRPLRNRYSWLPPAEKIAQEARLLGRTYWSLRHLAGLIRWCGLLAQQQGIKPTAQDLADLSSEPFGLKMEFQEVDGSSVHGRSFSTHQAFLHRLGQIQSLRRTLVGPQGFPELFPQYFQLLQQLSPRPLSSNAIADGEVKTRLELGLYRAIAFLWALAVQLDEQPDFSLRTSVLQSVEGQILHQNGFNTLTAWQTWLQEYQALPTAFENPMRELIRLEGITSAARWWKPIRAVDPTVCYLSDALKLSGWDGVLQERLESYGLLVHHRSESASYRSQSSPHSNTQSWKPLLDKWCLSNGLATDISPAQLAFWLDFSDADDFLDALMASDGWGE